MLAPRGDDALTRAAAELGVAVDAALRRRVAAEQHQMVLAHTRAGTLIASVFAVLMAWYAHGTVATAWVIAWILAKLCVAALRVATAARQQQDAGPAAESAHRRRTDVLLAVDGAIWGLAGWHMMTQSDTVVAVVAASLACVSCVATFGLQARSVATAAYTLPILLPTAGGLFGRGDEVGFVGGIGLLLLQALLVLTARAAEARLVAGLLLRERALSLAHEKDEALQLARHQGAVKNQFLAKLSHELRTPLHGILGLTRLLRDDAGGTAPAARRLELVEASASHLLTLIDDLLDVSRIETGRLALREEPVDLAALVREVGELHALRAQARGLSFETAVSLPSPCWVRADAARLRQVLHNLVGNAVKFTRHGGVGLRVERDATGGDLRVTVRDSGQGIAPEDLAHVFEAFRQGRAADGQPADGVGLGLTIAREIARALHGDISVTSEPGVGSTFVFTARLPTADPPAAVPAPLPLQHGLKRALVAEDDDVNALIVGAFLAELGLEAERVVDGRAAVDAALRAQARPDVVLMDCTMPVLDGWAATRAIRQAERDRGWSPVPILALTATAGEADRRRCHDAGMDDVVTKPFTREQLEHALGTIAPRPT